METDEKLSLNLSLTDSEHNIDVFFKSISAKNSVNSSDTYLCIMDIKVVDLYRFN